MWYWYLLTGILALVAGVALGFFIARKYMMTYLKKNPPIYEQMLKIMMMHMSMKPSQKKINQIMQAMNKQMKLRYLALQANLNYFIFLALLNSVIDFRSCTLAFSGHGLS